MSRTSKGGNMACGAGSFAAGGVNEHLTQAPFTASGGMSGVAGMPSNVVNGFRVRSSLMPPAATMAAVDIGARSTASAIVHAPTSSGSAANNNKRKLPQCHPSLAISHWPTSQQQCYLRGLAQIERGVKTNLRLAAAFTAVHPAKQGT